MGLYQDAIADYDMALHMQPDYAEADVARSRAKEQLDQDQDTITASERADSAAASMRQGLAKVDRGEHRDAITDFDQAIQLQPDYVDAYYNRGVAKFHLGQSQIAISDYDIALRIQPDYAPAFVARGVAKASLGKHQDAIPDFDQAIQLEPDNATAYVNRGNARASLTNFCKP